MAEYLALGRVALTGGVVDAGTKFSSDDIPGRFWKPIDKEAKAAVRARDEASRAEAEEVAFVAGSGEPDPRIAELEAALAEATDLAKLRDDEITALTEDVASGLEEISRQHGEIEALTAERDEAKAALSKFDGDGDGNPGGSKPKPTE